MPAFLTLVQWVLLAAAASGSLYLIAAALAVREFMRRPQARLEDRPPVTVMKPLCGEEPELYENLRSYCRQRYPRLQLVFGVQNPRDPAIRSVRRLIAEFPEIDIALVEGARWGAGNPKVANLQNMLAAARHDILVMADADIRVGPGYVEAVVAALSRPGVGLVTCLYRGRAAGGLWSRLAALHINHGFFPQAVIGRALNIGSGCFGATIAMRKSTLEATGGFAAIADRLADDHALGEAVERLGLDIALSPYVVDNVVAEPSLRSVFRHELRWALTIRALAPSGFLGLLVTYPLALVVLAGLLRGWSEGVDALLLWVTICRGAMALTIDDALGLPRTPPWLMPIRDAVSFAVFVASFFTRTVAWRDQRLRIGPRGQLIPGRQTML